jgi:hypothetical protein
MSTTLEHEKMRFGTMSLKQLHVRLGKITDKQKLLNFIHCCGEKEMDKDTPHYYKNGYHALKVAARSRYEFLFPDDTNFTSGILNKVAIIEKVNPKYMDSTESISYPSTNHKVAITKTCPICKKQFTLQAGVDGEYCSEKCWRIGAYNQWEKKEFGNRKGYVDYSSPPKNSEGYEYLDTTDELIEKVTKVPVRPIKEKTKKSEPSKPIDFIDILPKRKLRLD